MDRKNGCLLMDEKDFLLIKYLINNSGVSYRDLGKKVQLSVTAVNNRVSALVNTGVIRCFNTNLNPAIFDAIPVMIIGHSKLNDLDKALKKISNSEFTSKVVVAGDNELYVSGFLKRLTNMDDYISLVKTTAKIEEPIIGIVNPINIEPPKSKNLAKTDFRIIEAIKENSRRSYSDVALEVGLSTRTIRRRINKLMESSIINMSIELIPELSEDIIAIFKITLKKDIEAKQQFIALQKKYSENLITLTVFNNQPDLILLHVWGRNMSEIKDLHTELKSEEFIRSVTQNIYYTTYNFPNWIDQEVYDLGSSLTKFKDGFKDKRHVEKEKSSDKIDLETLSELETYRSALEQALADGIITDDEEAILKSLRDSLDISEAQHKALLEMISLGKRDTVKEIETYRLALEQALEDGIITEDEQAILESLQNSLRISHEEHKKMLKKMRKEKR